MLKIAILVAKKVFKKQRFLNQKWPKKCQKWPKLYVFERIFTDFSINQSKMSCLPVFCLQNAKKQIPKNFSRRENGRQMRMERPYKPLPGIFEDGWDFSTHFWKKKVFWKFFRLKVLPKTLLRSKNRIFGRFWAFPANSGPYPCRRRNFGQK